MLCKMLIHTACIKSDAKRMKSLVQPLLPGRNPPEPSFPRVFWGKTLRPKGPVLRIPAVRTPFSYAEP